MKIPFSVPYRSPLELEYISETLEIGNTAGGGLQTKLCVDWLEKQTGAQKVLLTNSATAALEMSALLLGIENGDEIIMPSFTFSSSANAFILQGAKPVFIDVELPNLNINPELIIDSITPNTKAILVVHYAGVACDMEKILEICKKYNLYLIEDAAPSLMATWNERYLGTIGDLACFSFHSSKNIVSGEGGALVVNNSKFVERAKIILEKGTNREQFVNGVVDKYTWIDIGSSYLPSEITAAYLRSQLENAQGITAQRIDYWKRYKLNLTRDAEKLGVTLPNPPEIAGHNAHAFFMLMPNKESRDEFIKIIRAKEIICASHYSPLHSSKAGLKYGALGSVMSITEDIHSRLVRLPMWSQMGMPVDTVCELVIETLNLVIPAPGGRQ
jgi:dTDP-4-amino-4,6-dideoxygalactose transaminase